MDAHEGQTGEAAPTGNLPVGAVRYFPAGVRPEIAYKKELNAIFSGNL
jgi:hypothetical protein